MIAFPAPELRPYQIETIDKLRDCVRRGLKRFIMQASTGAGKTVMAADIMRSATERGKRVLFLAGTRELVYQCSDKLRRFEVPHGIIMAGEHPIFHRPVQVASKDTLLARAVRRNKIDMPKADIVIIDEAHHAVSAGHMKLMDAYPDAIHIGLTATPARGDGRGLSEAGYQEIVQAASMQALIWGGYLVPMRVFAPHRPDLKGVKTSGGDYCRDDVALRMDKVELVGDIVDHWKDLAQDRPTLVFASNVQHSIHIKDEFIKHGIPADQVDGETDLEQRAEIFRSFLNGDTSVLCGCEVFCEGVDLPLASCAVLARPTKSIVKYKQMCLDSQTEILTIDGWKLDCDDGDLVASYNSASGGIEWCRAENKFRRLLSDDESFYEIKSPHLDIRVTDQHAMLYQCRPDLPLGWQRKTAAELAKKRGNYVIPIAGLEPSIGVPLSDNELLFLGWFLSDGCLHKTTNQVIISQSAASPYNNAIKDTLVGCGLHFRTYTRKRTGKWSQYADNIDYCISRGDRKLAPGKRGWRHLGPYIDKDLSVALDSITPAQLSILLMAINMGDGAKPKNLPWSKKTYDISTGNKVFADRLQSLCVRRGFRCNTSTMHYNKNPLYILRIRPASFATVGGQCDKQNRCSLTPSPSSAGEEVWCLSTRYGTLVTRRNGKVAIVGNCGRIMRPWPGKQDGLVLDHAGIVYRFGFPDADCEWSLDGTESVQQRLDKAREEGKVKEPIVCQQCHCAYSGTLACPNCGAVPPEKKGRRVAVRDGILTELNPGEKSAPTQDEKQRYWHKCLYVMAAKGRTVGAASSMYKSHFGNYPQGLTPGVEMRCVQWPVTQAYPQYLRREKAYA